MILRDGRAGLHLVAFLDEELGDPARVGDQHPGRAHVEGEVSLDPLAARVLAPDGHAQEQQGDGRGQQRVDPVGHGPGERRLAQVLLALGVDRLLPEEVAAQGLRSVAAGDRSLSSFGARMSVGL